MTCIVGLVDKKHNNVVIGADSVAIADNSFTIRKDSKIFINDKFIIGCSGSFRMMQLIRFSFKPPRIGLKDIYEYLCTDFINSLRECFKQGGYLQRFEYGDEKGGVFLLAYEDRLFKIDSDFQVGESDNGMYACGCGDEFAIGALYALEHSTDFDAHSKVEIALSAASHHSFVHPPFVIYETNKDTLPF